MASNVTATPDVDQQRKKYDNSNPQQGSVVRTPSPSSSEDSTDKTPKDDAKPIEQPQAAHGGHSNVARTPPTKKDSRKLFVGGLPSDITKAEFHEFFEQFGEVVDSVVMFDRETLRSRGFGFVTFRDAEVANRILNMRQGDDPNGQSGSVGIPGEPSVGRLVMRGKTCEVKAAEPKEATGPTRRGYRNQNGAGGNSSVGRLCLDKTYVQGARQAKRSYATCPYDAHFMAATTGHQYHTYSPGYYSAYHPGMYAAGGYNQTAPMYAPAVPTGIPSGHQYGESPQHYGGPPPPLSPYLVDGVYLDSSHEASLSNGYAQPPAPTMMYYHQAYAADYHGGYYPNQKELSQQHFSSTCSASVMQPAAPGLPTKDEIA